MKSQKNERRLLWLLCGVICGLGLAYVWPHEPAYAVATDRDAKFAICTVEVGPGLPEAVFVLDFSTGRMHGGMLNSQSGMFSNFWFADVQADFKVQGKGGAKFTMIPGQGYLTASTSTPGGGGTTATGVLYIGELTTGKVGCYKFHYVNNTAGGGEPMQLEPVNYFVFRDASKK